MFRTVPLCIIRSFSPYTQQWYMSYRFADNWVPSWSCSQAVSKSIWHIPLLCVQWKTHDDGQRNCPKHVEFHSKNKFEKLEHLVGFIIRNLTRCMVTWTSNTLLILVFIYCVHRSLTGITTHQNHSSLYVVASIYAISKMFQIVVVF